MNVAIATVHSLVMPASVQRLSTSTQEIAVCLSTYERVVVWVSMET